MQPTDDRALLRQYTENNSDDAFAALVTRHINLVYSVALRQVGNPHHAEEIVQAVFIILAKKAAQLRQEKALASWLFQAPRLTANNFIRSESRRHRREEEAFMQSVLDEAGTAVWPRIAPLLDDAVAALRTKDREALVLRFYEGRNLREVGAALGASEDAAEKRVNRALEKLRKFFTKRGVNSTAEIIAGAISAHSVSAAPVGLALKISAVAVAKGAAAGTSTLTLVKGALKIMAWTKMKTAIVVAVSVLLVAGTAEVTVRYFEANDSWRNMSNFFSRAAMQAALAKTPPQVTILPTIHSGWGAMWWSDKTGRRLGMSSTITNLLMDAYGVRNTHMAFSEPMPGGKYDFIANPPQGSATALQKKIEEQFGVVAHKEVIETNVWVLKAGDPDKLGAVVSRKKSPHQELKYVDGKTIAVLEDESVDRLADALEGWLLEAPVMNRTGLSGRYDLNLNWDHHDKANSTAALVDQLHRAGFELMSNREQIEMLIVEKVK